MRERLKFLEHQQVAVVGRSGSAQYARQWLTRIGVTAPTVQSDATKVVIRDGTTGASEYLGGDARVVINVWDFQFGTPGTGVQASAASGVSCVLGFANGPPLALPAELPEKWCGMVAAMLSASSLLEAEISTGAATRVFDVAAADVLRAFADQNNGNHLEVEGGWERNGSVAVEHGGIFPQGFFPCHDGYVAIVGRSRKDWTAIKEAVGSPSWTKEERFEDPFTIAEDAAEAEALLVDALAAFTRDELLERALATGATIAPVYDKDELRTRDIVRPDFFSPDGLPGMPWTVRHIGDITGDGS